MVRGGASNDRPIRLLLVDDQESVRRALRQLLEAYPDFDVVGEVDSGETAIEATERLDPDVVLMDCSLATTMNGIAATREIKHNRTTPRVVLITMDADLEREATASGVDGFIVKGCTADSLLDVVRRVSGVTQ